MITINFYTICNMLFSLGIEKFTFPAYTRFNSVSSAGIRVFGIESIKTFYEDGEKLISIYLDSDLFPNIYFDDGENIKNFKKSTIDVNKEHLLSLLFGGRCFDI